MTSEKEFTQKVKEIREKLDLESGTPQKNKALLQYLKEYCASTLSESNPNASFEKKIKAILFETEQDMEKILNIQPMEKKQKAWIYASYVVDRQLFPILYKQPVARKARYRVTKNTLVPWPRTGNYEGFIRTWFDHFDSKYNAGSHFL